MTKLSRLTPSDLDEEGNAVWNEITNGPRSASLSLVGDDGALVGPFNAMLHRPSLARGFAQVGEEIRFANSLPTNVLEVAICTVGAHWKAEFEWWAHSRFALEAGVDSAALDAIRLGREPAFTDDAERIAHAYARSLLQTGRPDPDTDAEAQAIFSEPQLVDLASAIGYYCYISFSLNAFEIPLPEGVDPAFS